MSKITLAVLLGALTLQAAADPIRFATWPHDMRLQLGWSRVGQTVVDVINATKYSGRFDTGSSVCSHYDVSIFVDPDRTSFSDLSTIAWLNPGAGFCGRARAQIHAKLQVSGCPTLEPSVGCDAIGCLSGSVDSLAMHGSCGLGLLPPAQFGTEIKLPFSPSTNVPIDLTSSTSSPTEKTQLTFGRFEADGSWTDLGPKRTIAIGARTLGLGGEPARDFDNASSDPSVPRTRANTSLVLDATVGAIGFEERSDAKTVLADLASDSPLGMGAGMAISVSPTFFLRKYGDGRLSGVFGELLPIRMLYATQLPNGKFANVELYLTGGGVQFDAVDKKATVDMSLATSRPVKAWLSDAPGAAGTALSVRQMGVRITFHPEVRSGGRLAISLDQFRVDVQFVKNLPSLHTCILTAQLAKALAGLQIPLGTLGASVTVATPDCIPIGTNSMQATRPCAEFGNQKAGFMSNDVAGGVKKQLGLLLTSIQFVVDKGRLLISVPAA